MMKQRTEPGDWEETGTEPRFNTPEYHLWYTVIHEAVKDWKSGTLDPKYLDSEDFKRVCSFAGVTSPEIIKSSLDTWEQEEGN